MPNNPTIADDENDLTTRNLNYDEPDVMGEVSSPAEPPYTPPPKRPVYTKPAFLIGLTVAILLIAGVALFAWLHYRNRVSTDNAQIDGHIVPVSSKIYGTVAQVLVDDNQPVKAGDVLVRIDPRDYQARVDQAQASLAYAESQSRAAGAVCHSRRKQLRAGLRRQWLP